MFAAMGGINLNGAAVGFNFGNKFQGVSSRHPAGVIMARADGSVGFVTETVSTPNDFVDESVAIVFDSPYKKLLGRADGNVLVGIE